MRTDQNKLKARFVRKEAPAFLEKRMWSGGADIKDGYVLGLRFKPAPVFHFLGLREAALGKRAQRILQNLPHAGKIRADGRFASRLSWGVTFDE
jgi:hypothetical protein